MLTLLTGVVASGAGAGRAGISYGAAPRSASGHRLAATISRAVTLGRPINVSIRDSSGVGGVDLTICTTPPGGRRSCAPAALATGRRRKTIRIQTPRPGGWRISLRPTSGWSRRGLAWVSRRGGGIRLLAAGDSEMQILDGLLSTDLGRYGVQTTGDARVSTALTAPFRFNWANHARAQAASLRPDVTIFFIGANDGFSVAGPRGPVACCGRAWSAGYANLVAGMMRTYLRGAAGRVYWFLLPTPRAANFQSVFNGVNAGIRRAAARFPGRVGLIDANAFFTPGNRYRDFMVYRHHGFVIHESDGTHLSSASDAVAARLVVHTMLADHVIR